MIVQDGMTKKTMELQKMLLNLLETKLFAVCKVTRDNRGKNTRGVDKVRSLAP